MIVIVLGKDSFKQRFQLRAAYHFRDWTIKKQQCNETALAGGPGGANISKRSSRLKPDRTESKRIDGNLINRDRWMIRSRRT